MATIVVYPSLIVQLYQIIKTDTEKVFFKFPLPEITGTINTAVLSLFIQSNSSYNGEILNASTSSDATWTSSTDGATLDSIVTTTTISTKNSYTIGENTWNVLTTGINSLAAAYSVCNPGNFTVLLENPNEGGTEPLDETTTTMQFHANGGEETLTVYGPTAAIENRPKLTIDYTGSLGCTSARIPRQSGMVGAFIV